jgi:hypothetical protein
MLELLFSAVGICLWRTTATGYRNLPFKLAVKTSNGRLEVLVALLKLFAPYSEDLTRR